MAQRDGQAVPKGKVAKPMRQSFIADRASFVESTLTLIFWLCASLLIMQPARLYFTYEIAQFFNFETHLYERYRILFMPFPYAYTLTLFVSIFLVRFVSHAHVLAFALILFLLLVVELFLLANLSTMLLGIALGLIPASAVCVVVEKLGVYPSARQRDMGSVGPPRVRPVGMYILIPVLVTLAVIFKNVLSLILILLCLSTLILLLRSRHFGGFTSAPTFTQGFAGTLANGMFYLVIFMLILISLIDVFVLYYISHVVRMYAFEDIKNTTALVLLIMLIVRIAMIIFAELALIRMAPRRMLVFSACAIVLSVLLLSVARNEEAQLIMLFVLSSSLSVAFPSLIKSIAKFTPFSVLPTSIVSMALVGNMVTFFGTAYLFPHALRTKNIGLFLLLFAFVFLMLAMVFFIISRRKKWC